MEVNRIYKRFCWTTIPRYSELKLVGGLEHGFYDFPYLGNVIILSDELHQNSEGWRKTSNQETILNNKCKWWCRNSPGHWGEQMERPGRSTQWWDPWGSLSSYEFVTHGDLSCLWLMIILSFLVGRHGKAMSNTVSKCFVAILLRLDPVRSPGWIVQILPVWCFPGWSTVVHKCYATRLGHFAEEVLALLSVGLYDIFYIFLMIQESGASSHAGHSKEPFLKNRCWGWTLSGSYRAVCPRAQRQNPTRYNAPSTTTTQGWQSLDSGGHQGDWN